MGYDLILHIRVINRLTQFLSAVRCIVFGAPSALFISVKSKCSKTQNVYFSSFVRIIKFDEELLV